MGVFEGGGAGEGGSMSTKSSSMIISFAMITTIQTIQMKLSKILAQ